MLLSWQPTHNYRMLSCNICLTHHGWPCEQTTTTVSTLKRLILSGPTRTNLCSDQELSIPTCPSSFQHSKKKICKLAINKQFAWQKSWRYCKDVKLHASKSCKVFQSGSQWSAAAADCTNLRTVAWTMHHTLKILQYIYPTKTQDGYFCCLVFRFNFGIPNSMPRRLRHLNRPQQVFFIPSNIGRNCTKELSSALGSQKIKQSRNAAKNNWSAMHMCSNSTV